MSHMLSPQILGRPAPSAASLMPEQVDEAVHRALAALKQGLAVVLQDDPDRENEGDLVIPAATMDEAMMALFIRECSGIVCLCLEEAQAQALALPPMVAQNQSRYGTAFTVTIEAREGVTTGVSARDRLTTIRAATRAGAQAEDLARPGHVFPLRAHPQGVLGRRGHTEGSVDLARLAGFAPAAVLCELMNPDGTMMKGPALAEFAASHGFPLLSIAELADYRQRHGA